MAGYVGALPPAETGLPLGETRRFQGTLAEDPRRTADGYRLVVDLRALADAADGPWQDASGRILLHLSGEPEPAPFRGDVVTFRATLRPPRGLRNPGRDNVETRLRRLGIQARASASWPGSLSLAAPGAGAGQWHGLRRLAASRLQEAAPGQAGAVLRALALGDRSALHPDTVDSFRQAGTSHLLAISGLHLGILALLLTPPLMWVLARVPRVALACPLKPAALALTLPLLGCYAALSGFQTSTVRALAMTGLLLLALSLSRAVKPSTALVSTALILGLVDPRWLREPGLHLSLAALAGLFWVAPLLQERLRPAPDPLARLGRPPSLFRRLRRKTREGLTALACASLAATATTAPVSAYHFGEASLVGLLLNPLAVPLVGFGCLPLALAGAAAGLVAPGAGYWPAALAGGGIRALLAVQATFVPLVEPLSWPPIGTLWGLAGSGALLGAATLALRAPARRGHATLLLGAGLTLLVAPVVLERVSERVDGRTHLWLLDVGQGQSVALRMPGLGWALVDAGGFPATDFDVGEQVVVPALRQLGCRRLWLAVSTHPHPDHLGGFPAALRWGRPRELWLPGSFEGDERYRPLLEEADRVGCSVRWVPPAGWRREVQGGGVEAGWVAAHRENDRSLVLRISWAGRSVLLPGDLEAAGQRLLLGSPLAVPSDLMVAPHHGASNALLGDFLRAVRPGVVLISAGGRPGLPSARFVEAAETSGAAVLSTHQRGFLHAWVGPEGVGAAPGGD